jgi:hypothetical protein
MLRHSRRSVVLLAGLAGLAGPFAGSHQSGSALTSDRALRLTLSVVNPDTGVQVKNGATIPAGTPFQAIAETNDVDCAGQLVVSALGTLATRPPCWSRLSRSSSVRTQDGRRQRPID